MTNPMIVRPAGPRTTNHWQPYRRIQLPDAASLRKLLATPKFHTGLPN